MAMTATANKCLNCGSENFDEIWALDQYPILFGAVPAKKRDTVKRYPLTISVCRDCSLIQQTNLLSKDLIDEIYEEEYYSCPSPATNPIGREVVNEFYEFFTGTSPVRTLEKSGRTLGKVLEIACFDGYLMQKLEKSWDVYGCDPSTATGRIALSHFGKSKITNDYFTKESYPKHHFDVVIFRHVLEHLYDLHSFLDSVFNCLKPDGCIYIEVPNVENIFEFGSFESFFHQHISYFSINAIEDLLKKHCFKVVNYQVSGVLHVKAIKEENAEAAACVIGSNNVRDGISGFYEKAKMIKSQLRSVFDDPRYQNIAIFGASAMATVMMDIIDERGRKKVRGILDNDTGKQGKYIVGADVPISSPETVKSGKFDAVIISSYLFYGEIYAQLKSLGVDNNKIISITETVSDFKRG